MMTIKTSHLSEKNYMQMYQNIHESICISTSLLGRFSLITIKRRSYRDEKKEKRYFYDISPFTKPFKM